MIFETQDGSHSIFSDTYQVSYHSKYGAIQETEHVFINAGLRLKAVEQSEISILGIGMGTGLNVFMTYLEAQKRALSIDYTAVEAFPITMEEAKQLNYAEQLKRAETAEIFLKIHESNWEAPFSLDEDFRLTKVQKKFEDLNFQNQFDIIYFDAFAPSYQPELWTIELLQIMYNALKANGVLVTYCAQGQFKRNLKAIGFAVEPIPGPPGKREMTRANK
jgi:tRNA U34 5-methylaminomethyl-2-thiouridine-forming methyltransferase MnmC